MINSAEEYDAALKEITRLWNAQEGTADYARLDELASLVEEYERVQWSIA